MRRRTPRLLLAAVLMLALASCGGEENTMTAVEVGDTVTIDTIELTVETASFHQCLDNTILEGEYLTPVDLDGLSEEEYTYHVENNLYYADSEHCMLLITFTQENVGSEMARALNPENAMEILWEGESYPFGRICGGWIDEGKVKYMGFPYTDLEASSEPIHCRAAIRLPIEAMESEGTDLVLRVVGYDYRLR